MSEINLSHRDLTSLPNGFGQNLPKLKTLTLNDNQLTSLPNGFGQNLPKLKYLRLYNNQLTSLPDGFGENLPKLGYLYLYDNQLTSLPADFGYILSNMPNLNELELYNNKLTYLPAGFGQNLQSLTNLALSDNSLTSLPDGFGQNLPNLKDLSLYNNKLTSLPDGFGQNLPKLEHLSLNNNQLTRLPDGFSHNLPSLESLALNGNQFTSLPVGLKDNLPNLNWISVTIGENEIDNLTDIMQKINSKYISELYSQLEDLLKSRSPIPPIILNSLNISNILYINNYTDITVCNNYNSDDNVVFSSVNQIPLDKFFVLQLEQEANTTSFRFCLERDDYIPFMKNNVLANWIKNPNSRLPQIETMGYGGIPGNERYYNIPYVTGPAGEMKHYINQHTFELIDQPPFPYGITVFTLYKPHIARLGNIYGRFGVSDTHGQTVQTVWELKSKDILYKQ